MTAVRPVPLWIPAESDAPGTGRSIGPWAAVLLMAVAWAAIFIWLSIVRHQAYQSHAFDLGNMDQAVWNTLHGHPFRFTDMEVGGRVLTSRLAIHVEPLLLPLSLLYLIHSGPETLLVVQVLVVAAGAPAAYRLGRALLGRPWMSLVFPATYLLHPSLQNAVLDDFHAVTMSSCLLMWALYFALMRRLVPFAVFAAVAMATKEEVGLLVAAMGVLLVFRRQLVAGAATMVAGAGWFFICVLFIIPSFNPSGRSPYLARYAYLGHGLGGILMGTIHHPHAVAQVLAAPSRVAYLDTILHPLAFASVLGLPILLLALPIVLINMLSADPSMYSGFFQYSAEVVPVVVGSAAAGATAIDRAARRVRPSWAGALVPVICLVVLGSSLIDARILGFSPVAAGYIVPSAGAHQNVENRILALVPPGAVVAAADEMEPHLSERHWVYLLPTVHPRNGPAALFIALDASVPSLPVRPATLHGVADRAMGNGYGIVAARDGVLLLRRGSNRHRLPASFYSFAFAAGTRVTSLHSRWGALDLVGFTVHPRSLAIDRARPAISIETYWRVRVRLPSAAHPYVALSPTYGSNRPRWSSRWQIESDSPTLDWLPPRRWPKGRTIRVAFVSFLPDVYRWGKVDVAIGVRGLGPAHARGPAGVPGDSDTIRAATIRIGL